MEAAAAEALLVAQVGVERGVLVQLPGHTAVELPPRALDVAVEWHEAVLGREGRGRPALELLPQVEAQPAGEQTWNAFRRGLLRPGVGPAQARTPDQGGDVAEAHDGGCIGGLAAVRALVDHLRLRFPYLSVV